MSNLVNSVPRDETLNINPLSRFFHRPLRIPYQAPISSIHKVDYSVHTKQYVNCFERNLSKANHLVEVSVEL